MYEKRGIKNKERERVKDWVHTLFGLFYKKRMFFTREEFGLKYGNEILKEYQVGKSNRIWMRRKLNPNE